jgi:predicted nucleic acid-binding protein
MLLLDTDVMIEVLRGSPQAVSWLQSLGTTPLGLPGLVAMELLQGCRNRTEQQNIEKRLKPYQLFWPSPADCQGAYADFVAYYLSHSIGILDTLIAHTAIGVNAELATFNIKHYHTIANLQIVQPYKRT